MFSMLIGLTVTREAQEAQRLYSCMVRRRQGVRPGGRYHKKQGAASPIKRLRGGGEMSEITTYAHGDKVRYIPNHANGDITHPDCQNGIVSSVNDRFVFVKYDCLACTMCTGDEPYTAQATKRENLVKRA